MLATWSSMASSPGMAASICWSSRSSRWSSWTCCWKRGWINGEVQRNEKPDDEILYRYARETRWDGKREDEIREKRCRSVGGLLKWRTWRWNRHGRRWTCHSSSWQISSACRGRPSTPSKRAIITRQSDSASQSAGHWTEHWMTCSGRSREGGFKSVWNRATAIPLALDGGLR